MNLQESNGCSFTNLDPSPNYMKKITTVLGVQEGIALVNPKGARPQGARRQMAGTSLRNLASQIATTLCSNFVRGEYDQPSNLCKGAILAHNIMEDITGQKMRPIEPFQIGNFDMIPAFV